MKLDMAQSMGAILRQAREAKGLSLEDVSKATKISVPVLTALEADALSRLPSGIYARAFVRTYSAFLGIGNAALEELERAQKSLALPAAAAVKPETPATEWVGNDRKPRARILDRRWIAAIAVVWALLAIGGLIAGVSRHVSRPQPALSLPEPKSPEVTAAAAVPVLPPAQQISVKPEKIQAPVIAPVRDGLTLEVRALDKVWIRVKADNLLLFEGTLAKNDSESWKAEREFLLRVGSASAVSLWLNDAELSKSGRKGEVKTFVINKDGIVKTR